MKTDKKHETEIERMDRVVIAAAVAAVVGSHATIRGIRAASGRGEGSWLREGRLAIQGSRRLGNPLMRAVR